jgi:hypothetical protein
MKVALLFFSTTVCRGFGQRRITLADRKTKSCRALIAFRFLKLNLFAFKFGELIVDSLHEVLAGPFFNLRMVRHDDGSLSSGWQKITRKKRKLPPPVYPHRKPNQATLWSRKLDADQKRGILPRTGELCLQIPRRGSSNLGAAGLHFSPSCKAAPG